MSKVFEHLKAWARSLQVDTYALYLAYRDPRVSWYAGLWAVIVAAYALSPIDLIPDPIPVLGYLDDLILVPLGIFIAVRLIPEEVLEECRQQAQENIIDDPGLGRRAAALIALIWLLLAAALLVVLGRWWSRTG